MCVTSFCLVFPFFFLFLHVCCFVNVALSSSALLSFVRACFAFSCWCCRLDEHLGSRGGGQDDEESLFASDAGSWYTVSDVDCCEDSSDDGDDVDDDSTTSVGDSDDDDDDDSDDGSDSNNVSGSEGVEDGFTLLHF